MIHTIFTILRQHQGRECAITAREIALAADTNERQVRRIIAAHGSAWSDSAGAPLLAAPNGGFFFATEDEEVIRRRRLLISNELQAKTKRRDFDAMCARHGLSGIFRQERTA